MARAMSKPVHRIYIGVFVLLVLVTGVSLSWMGASYYSTSLEERFFHTDHTMLKPSGPIGHGLGIIGTLCILFGVGIYMTRKYVKRFRNLGVLRHWLEFHIFLCSIGPLMVLFHTAFKFGGIVSISFWSMVAVVISGVIGRFIYIQIPRTIGGRQLSLQEVRDLRVNISNLLMEEYPISDKGVRAIVSATAPAEEEPGKGWFGAMLHKTRQDRRTIRGLRSLLKEEGVSAVKTKQLLQLVRNEIALNNRINRLRIMQKLFKYWHVAHLPFAILMLLIMVVHVAVTLAFGYKWIF